MQEINDLNYLKIEVRAKKCLEYLWARVKCTTVNKKKEESKLRESNKILDLKNL